MLRRSIQHGLIAHGSCRAAMRGTSIYTRAARPTLLSYSTAANTNTDKRSVAAWSIATGTMAVTAAVATQAYLQPEDWRQAMAALGLSRGMVYNDSNKGAEPLPQPSFWQKLPLPYFLIGDRPQIQPLPLDNDLTVTSWKQQEQMHLIDAPGVLIWGSNKHGLVDPTGSTPAMVQIPQRLKAFEGQVLRDLKLGDDVAAAVDRDGNLYQWGTGFQKEKHSPELTLKNRNLKQVAISESRLFALAQDGSRVYVVPKVRPVTGPSAAAIDFVPSNGGGGLWKYVGLGGSSTSKQHDPMTQLPVGDVLQPGETIRSIAAGKNHLLMVTSAGRVLGSEDGLSVAVVGAGEFKQAKIVEVACGDVHSLARDERGRCWAWGVNGFGQLAQGAYSHANLRLPTPTIVPGIESSVEGPTLQNQDWVGCTRVAAANNTSYFVVRDKKGYKVLSAGMGQWGQLGDGTFTHIQGTLVTIAPLSNRAEYKEDINKTIPIGIHDLVPGSTHVFAVLDNTVNTAAQDGAKPISYGRDVMSWGQNTYFQLLTGKRNNRAEPTHALPVDSELLRPADAAVAAIASGDSPVISDTKKLEDPRNRLQLSPARCVDDDSGMDGKGGDKMARKANSKAPSQKGDVASLAGKWAEEKLAAGNGVTAVYCQETEAPIVM